MVVRSHPKDGYRSWGRLKRSISVLITRLHSLKQYSQLLIDHCPILCPDLWHDLAPRRAISSLTILFQYVRAFVFAFVSKLIKF